MGLDLFCGDQHIRAGSYSTVMYQFGAILRAYVLFLEEAEPIHGGINDMDKALQRVENRRRARLIKACLFEKDGYDEAALCRIRSKLHQGIADLLLGCGSVGSWTPFQAREILQCLERLKPYFSRVPELELNKKGNFYLEPIFRKSAQEGEEIRFA